MNKAVIDPPPYKGKYLFQEECCINLNPKWMTPASSLRIATQENCQYIPPVTSWEQFVEISKNYDEVFMIFSYPICKTLEVPKEIRSKIIVVGNPSTFAVSIEDWGFQEIRRLVDYNLDISKAFDNLFLNRSVVIQICSGCQFLCDYCVWNRSLGYEIKWLDPVRSAYLSDLSSYSMLLCPQITGNSKWVQEFINNRKTQKPFSTDVNSVHIDKYEDDIRRLSKTGLNKVVVGTESFSNSALRKLKCPHTVKQSIRLIQLVAELGIYGAYQLKSGFGETIEEIIETRNTLIELGKQIKPEKIRQRINVGPFLYWHKCKLQEGLTLHNVQYLGFPVLVETLEKERNDAWLETYRKLRR